jgi:hypothetical protein
LLSVSTVPKHNDPDRDPTLIYPIHAAEGVRGASGSRPHRLRRADWISKGTVLVCENAATAPDAARSTFNPAEEIREPEPHAALSRVSD